MSQYNWNPDDEEQTPLDELQEYFPHVHVKDEGIDEEWMDLMDEWEDLNSNETESRRANRLAKRNRNNAE